MFSLLIFIIILAAVYAILNKVPFIPAWLKDIGNIVIGVIALIYILQFLISFAHSGHQFSWGW